MNLLDTDIIIDYLRGHEPAVQFIKTLDIENTAVCVITVGELLAGQHNANPAKRRALVEFLGPFQSLEVDHFVAVAAGDMAREYGMQLPDALIAATARQYKATLYTRNVKDFGRVKNLEVRKPF